MERLKCDFAVSYSWKRWSYRYECKTCGYVQHRKEKVNLRRRCGKQGQSPCVHLGNTTGNLYDCPSCRGSVRIKARACELHGECLPKHVDTSREFRSCLQCGDYHPPPTSGD